MTRRLATTLRCSLLLLLALPAPLAAQLQVRVVSQGAGVRGAEVQAWSESRNIGRALTDASGAARLVLPATPQPRAFLTVRRLGFAPARAVLDWETVTSGVTFTIELAPTAASLPVLAVRERKLRCPSVSEPEADSLWRRVASRYADGWQQLHFGYEETFDEEEIVAPEARGFGEPLTHRRRSVIPPDAILRQLLASPPPYAAYERHIDNGGEYWKWRYARLQQYAAGHFTTETFRARHVLTVIDSSEAGTVIGFCPRTKDSTEIRGELVIGPDSLFKSGRWSYLVSHDEGDDAGAEAVFGTTMFEGRTYLVAVQGTMWRHDGRRNYKQDRFALSSWRYGRQRTDAVPAASGSP